MLVVLVVNSTRFYVDHIKWFNPLGLVLRSFSSGLVPRSFFIFFSNRAISTFYDYKTIKARYFKLLGDADQRLIKLQAKFHPYYFYGSQVIRLELGLRLRLQHYFLIFKKLLLFLLVFCFGKIPLQHIFRVLSKICTERDINNTDIYQLHINS